MGVIASLEKLWQYCKISQYWHIWYPDVQSSGGRQYCDKVDNLWAYYRLRLVKESSEVTAIITPWCLYRFLAWPFGISMISGEYQASMAHKVLEEFISTEQWFISMTLWFIEKWKIFLTNVGSGFGQNDQVQCQTQANQVLDWDDFSRILRTDIRRKWGAFECAKSSRNSRYSYPNVGFSSEMIYGNGQLFQRLRLGLGLGLINESQRLYPIFFVIFTTIDWQNPNNVQLVYSNWLMIQ